MKARERRKLLRSQLHHQKEREQRAEAEEMAGGPIAYKAEKAVSLPTPRDDFVLPAEKKDDAAFKVVNHAHQRSPNKKW